MKRIVSVLLTLALAVGLCTPALGAGEKNAHSDYPADSVYGADAYRYDTLTLAGEGMGAVHSYTVQDLEALARKQALGLGYENAYSLMTSGSVFTQNRFTGLRLYDLLSYSGMDAALPDATAVKLISKDGYTIGVTLGDLRRGYDRYSSKENPVPEETGLPVLVAYASDGAPLVGPTGDEPVYQRFTEAEGYVPGADNVGGPLRLIMGQTGSTQFNAPNCAKWLAAVVVGDPGEYVYTRDTAPAQENEPVPQGGDWTHRGAYPAFRLTVTGTEARQTISLSLAELEGMADAVERDFFAASAGKSAYEGIALKALVERYLQEGLEAPAKITVISADGYAKSLDVGDVMQGIDSHYQPGERRDVLLAYAVDGAPLVESDRDPGYNGANGYGPLRLVVENTISAWVKGVDTIVLGDQEAAVPPFPDLEGYGWAEQAVGDLARRGIVTGKSDGTFAPGEIVRRGDFMLILARAFGWTGGTGQFDDVAPGSYWYDAVSAARAQGVARGGGGAFRPEESLARQDAIVFLCRALELAGVPLAGSGDLSAFADGDQVASYARESVGRLAGAGIVIGGDGRLDPEGDMTRAELAVMLYRALVQTGEGR